MKDNENQALLLGRVGNWYKNRATGVRAQVQAVTHSMQGTSLTVLPHEKKISFGVSIGSFTEEWVSCKEPRWYEGKYFRNREHGEIFYVYTTGLDVDANESFACCNQVYPELNYYWSTRISLRDLDENWQNILSCAALNYKLIGKKYEAPNGEQFEVVSLKDAVDGVFVVQYTNRPNKTVMRGSSFKICEKIEEFRTPMPEVPETAKVDAPVKKANQFFSVTPKLDDAIESFEEYTIHGLIKVGNAYQVPPKYVDEINAKIKEIYLYLTRSSHNVIVSKIQRHRDGIITVHTEVEGFGMVKLVMRACEFVEDFGLAAKSLVNPFTNKHVPPLHPNCKSTTVPKSREPQKDSSTKLKFEICEGLYYTANDSWVKSVIKNKKDCRFSKFGEKELVVRVREVKKNPHTDEWMVHSNIVNGSFSEGLNDDITMPAGVFIRNFYTQV